MLRVVLDTNVVISSFIRPGGVPGRLRRAFLEGLFELWLSPPLLREIAEVLGRPAIRRVVDVLPEEIETFLLELPALSRIVDSPPDIGNIVPGDSDDDVVLATALAAGVDFIVSGDKPMLAIGEYSGIPIVTPRVFLDLLDEGRAK